MLASTASGPADQRPRAFCKGCRRRRKVNRINGCCSQCDDSSGPPQAAVVPRVGGYSKRLALGVAHSAPRAIDSPAAQRTQLLSSFLEAHFPVTTQLENDMHRRSSFMAQLPVIDLSSPLLSSAVTSLCLAYFGAQNNSARLLHASQNAYGAALGSLVRLLPATSRQPREAHREVIASILCLSLYDECTPPHLRDHSTWSTHFWGALQYLEALGPSSIDLDNHFESRMFTNLRFPAIILSYARRQASMFNRPEWRSLQLRRTYTSGRGPNQWFPLLTPLGELLQRADEIIANGAASRAEVLLELHQDFSSFRTRLLAFIGDEFQPATGPEAALELSPLDPSTLNLDLEEHRFLMSSTVIPTHYRFNGGPQQVMRCSITWFAVLIADCTVLRLLLHQPNIGADRTYEDTKAHAFSYAIDICRCVLGVSQLGSIAYAYVLEIFMGLASSFLEDYGAMQYVDWTRACLAAVRMRIKRLEQTNSPTLCRVGDLRVEFSDAGRYLAFGTPSRHDSGTEQSAITSDGVSPDSRLAT